jgi:Phosphoglucose isomerase
MAVANQLDERARTEAPTFKVAIAVEVYRNERLTEVEGSGHPGRAAAAGAETAAILPYEHYWKRVSAYGATSTGCQTGPVYWGEPGTNGQHSFYQFIHQDTRVDPMRRHHDILIANVRAQSEALAFGKTDAQVKAEGTADWLAPHPFFQGNDPHSVFTQGTQGGCMKNLAYAKPFNPRLQALL